MRPEGDGLRLSGWRWPGLRGQPSRCSVEAADAGGDRNSEDPF